MYINKQEVEKILSVMEEFPDARSYLLEADNSSGIGSILTLTMDMDINGRNAKVKVGKVEWEDPKWARLLGDKIYTETWTKYGWKDDEDKE